MIKIIQLALLIAATPIFCRAETGKEQYLEIGELCARAREPRACMESYGFECHQGRVPHKSVDARMLGCNLDLGDDRYHFVKLLYDNGGWNVEIEETYQADYSDAGTPEEDSALALSSYIRREMKGYRMQSGGGGAVQFGKPQYIETGARRDDGRIAVRALCGIVIGVQLDEAVSTQARADCERNLQRMLMKLSQPRSTEPYRVAAPSEAEWERRFARLISGDTALVWEGRYTFTEKHTPCLWISGCCSLDGLLYLDSCRTPTDSELRIIDACLEEGTHRSEEFFACLRTAGVKFGCEEQADGSGMCY